MVVSKLPRMALGIVDGAKTSGRQGLSGIAIYVRPVTGPCAPYELKMTQRGPAVVSGVNTG